MKKAAHTDETARQLENLVSIGIALSAEKDSNRLLEMILHEARRVTNADAGTLYLVEGIHLRMKIIHNETMNTFQGGKGEEVDLPPVPINKEYVSGYVAATGRAVNIPDVYAAKGFDFSGPCKYDSLTGYHTRSMLAISLKDHLGEVIGVLQLLNAMDEQTGEVTTFDQAHQAIVQSLSSLAAIALTNLKLIQEIENLFESFVQVMVTAIDAQTPYNATHTQQVSHLSELIALEINHAQDGPLAGEYFDDDRLKVLTMAGWLHDIGKVATPLKVMNKATRLGEQFPLVMGRIEYALQRERNALLWEELKKSISGNQVTKLLGALHNRIPEKEHRTESNPAKIHLLESARELIAKADNPATFIDDQLKEKLRALGDITFTGEDDHTYPLLTPEELASITVAKGTLTEEERKIMEDHVVITEKMLAKLPFTQKLAQAPVLACMHHEHLDGKGYPRGLKGDEIPLEARILAIADIYDALTASDRPYKKGMPVDSALRIMGLMAKDGKLDSDIMDLFIQQKIWEKLTR
ncbi:MAG TPA: GAF domain-containing protein [Firmicutes bacterium]|nr:GAF domain-containing protein [Bacillota bacterium]